VPFGHVRRTHAPGADQSPANDCCEARAPTLL
jgi:hypothetical protein